MKGLGGGVARPMAEWRHDRSSLVQEMAARHAARVTADAVSMPHEGGVWIVRLHSGRPIKVLSATLAGLTAGTVVTMCTPEHSPVAAWAQERGFEVGDYDTFCATPDLDLPPDLHCLDPGLA